MNNKTGLKEIIFNVVFFAFFIFLIWVGIQIIIKSNEIYETSKQISKLAHDNKTYTVLPIYTIVKEGYGQALLFFSMALGAVILLFLLPRLNNLTIGPTGVSIALIEVKEDLKAVIKLNNTLQNNSAGMGGGKNNPPNLETIAPLTSKEIVKDDPQKNQWGERNIVGSRFMNARIATSEVLGLYSVTITIESSDSNNPLKGVAQFYLHDTFSNPTPIIAVENGQAVLKLSRVYGAFTVGAVVDEGKTQLELDLSEIPGAPAEFLAK